MLNRRTASELKATKRSSTATAASGQRMWGCSSWRRWCLSTPAWGTQSPACIRIGPDFPYYQISHRRQIQKLLSLSCTPWDKTRQTTSIAVTYITAIMRQYVVIEKRQTSLRLAATRKCMKCHYPPHPITDKLSFRLLFFTGISGQYRGVTRTRSLIFGHSY